ncbi:geranylgeranyl reductase family protein [Acidimangrovimonas sediminis]|uniref:geranylgeranyl reductase family protein n=1 Tax=Acidimangrovimonas sediminis TaxID=2056283 RepID=UPI000C7F85D8|nr:NAD(P)/FAD-dependent oxidoreductase [Acidimangrovimonas sediminis]
MTRRYDILVSGLGPAGAAAAAAAARAGLSVLAVERSARPGLPVQCAEFVPMMTGAEVPEVRAARIQDIAEMETFVGADPSHLTPDFRGHMIDRARFDQALIEKARAAGAECRFGTPVRAISPDGVVTIGAGAAQETVTARLIIGADGPRSPVGAAAGCSNAELVETRQITVDLLRAHGATDIFLRPEIVGGYAWLFPKGTVANLGLGVVPGQKDRLKPLLDALHAQLVARGRLGPAVHRTTGGLIPVGGIVGLTARIGAVPVLLAGDAAGLTNPVTGAGISAAVISGALAGETAAAFLGGEAGALEAYAEEVEDTFGPSVALAVRRRRQLLAAYRGGAVPGPDALRRGWIAYPDYWTREETALARQETQTAEETA